MARIVCSDHCVGLVSSLNQLYTLDLSALSPQKEHYKLQFRLDGIASTTSSDHCIGVTDRFGRAFRVYSDSIARELTCPLAAKLVACSKHSLILMPVFEAVIPPEPSFDSLTSICEARVHSLINFWTAPELIELASMYNLEALQRNCEHFIASNLPAYLCPSNWELLRVISEENLQRIQQLVQDSDNQALIQSLAKRIGTVEPKPKAKRLKVQLEKAVPKAISEFNSLKPSFTPYVRPVKLPFTPEDFPTLQESILHPRPRANTDSFRPRKFSSPKHEDAPAITWTKPEREASIDFATIQAQQKTNDISVNAWGKVEAPSTVPYLLLIQEEAREEAELEEALRLIAEMEAREAQKAKAKPRGKRRRKQTS
mmetsp:Transcript_25643/g.44873  ORF Transcript_25643/g.44873 Transcript_25643/m.44873 type:complete len:370 (+) Transcript_25643:872-1981(+)